MTHDAEQLIAGPSSFRYSFTEEQWHRMLSPLAILNHAKHDQRGRRIRFRKRPIRDFGARWKRAEERAARELVKSYG